MDVGRRARWLGACAAMLGWTGLEACGSSVPASADTPVTKAAPRLGLNDVSVLLPLVALDDTAGWAADAAGDQGPLLPLRAFDAIPAFPVTTTHTLEYKRLRVVGVRFDGCFQRPEGCEPQIRLVFQPLQNGGTARDSALHAFYKLTPEAFTGLVASVRTLRTLAPEVSADQPLGPHPALAAQGLAGPYGQALRTLVLHHAGASNLERLTFFLRAPPSRETWFFGVLERSGEAFVQGSIAGIGQGFQRVIRPATPTGYQYDVDPAPTTPENANLLFNSQQAAAAGEDDRKAAYAAVLRIENPQKHGVDELSCAGCHVGAVVAAHAEATWGYRRADFASDAYPAEGVRGHTEAAAATPSSLRAFGYFDRTAMVSPRVVFESAEVVRDLEARYPPAAAEDR